MTIGILNFAGRKKKVTFQPKKTQRYPNKFERTRRDLEEFQAFLYIKAPEAIETLEKFCASLCTKKLIRRERDDRKIARGPEETQRYSEESQSLMRFFNLPLPSFANFCTRLQNSHFCSLRTRILLKKSPDKNLIRFTYSFSVRIEYFAILLRHSNAQTNKDKPVRFLKILIERKFKQYQL